MISFVSSVMKNIVVFAFTIWPQFRFLLDLDLELICCTAFESASSACCSLKSIAIISSRLQGYLVHFSAQAQKIKKKKKKNKKIYYIFLKIFFLHFVKWNFLAPFLYFITPNSKFSLKKFQSLRNSYISERNLQSLKNKNFLYFFKKVFSNFGMISLPVFSKHKSIHLFLSIFFMWIFYVSIKIIFF